MIKSLEKVPIKIYLSNTVINEQLLNFKPSIKVNNTKDITKTW